MAIHSFGRIEQHDARNLAYPMRLTAPGEPAPTYAEQRYYRRGERLNQLTTPTCVGHGYRHKFNIGPRMDKEVPGFSAFDIYAWAQAIDPWAGAPHEGTTVLAATKALQARGLIGTYVWAYNAQTIMDWITAGKGPVVIGVDWKLGMLEPPTSGPKRGWIQPTGPSQGGHCVVIDGAHRARGVFRGLNSWGDEWGDHGGFWILAEHLDTLVALAAGGEAVAEAEIPNRRKAKGGA